MKILMNDYGGYSFPLELSQTLSARNQIIHSYAQYVETPQANFVTKSKNSKLKIVPIKINTKFKKDNFLQRRSLDIYYGKKIINLIKFEKPNIVICANTPLDSLHQIISYCKTNEIKTIFWMQDIYSLAISKVLEKKLPIIGKLIGRYYRYIEKKCEDKSDKIIIISSDFKKFIDKKNLNKTSVIENWSPITKPKVSKIQFYKRKFNPLNKFCFIYSGTLGYKHNYEIFIKIAKHFPNAIIIVSSKGKLANRLKKISKENSLNIRVINWIDYKYLSSFLSIANAFIVTLESDASFFSVPSKIYVYLTIGKPIIASMPIENLASKTIKKMKVGLISDPGNFKSLISNLNKLVKDKKFQKKLSINSSKTLKSRQKSINQMINIIINLNNQFCNLH